MTTIVFKMDYNQEQSDEIEALKAIFEDDFSEITRNPPCFMIKITDHELSLPGQLSLKVTFTPKYPEDVPVVEVPLGKHQVLSKERISSLSEHLKETASNSLGMAMVFTLVEETKAWLSENVSSVEESAENVMLEEESDPEEIIELTEPKPTGGRWEYVIGLLGKPSAGKSTFFNACTGQNQAKTAAHPFTTIEPNISKAFYTILCPCAKMAQKCDAAYGHNLLGHRYVPVLLKDVAGLVPGACDGKGRGNRFLNDLLDADVFIHVVDVSGCTDENGEPAEDYDPTKDIRWLMQEIHQWIYGNLQDKWQNVCRRPQRLFDMFSGYHANRATVYAALKTVGVNEKNLANLPNWGEDMIHRIVDGFLKVRFPVYLVLNKSDTATATKNIERIKEKYPEQPMLEVSAKTECQLLRLCEEGLITYHCGDSKFEWKTDAPPQNSDVLSLKTNTVFDRFGGTNVQRALSEAVEMKPPTYAYPVDCLDTLMSIHKYRDQPPGVLRDCVLLKPGTTIEQLYTVLSHYPLYLVAGDFIRVEGVNEKFAKRIFKKGDIINDTNCILKIFTNRKVTQVKFRE